MFNSKNSVYLSLYPYLLDIKEYFMNLLVIYTFLAIVVISLWDGYDYENISVFTWYWKYYCTYIVIMIVHVAPYVIYYTKWRCIYTIWFVMFSLYKCVAYFLYIKIQYFLYDLRSEIFCSLFRTATVSPSSGTSVWRMITSSFYFVKPDLQWCVDSYNMFRI